MRHNDQGQTLFSASDLVTFLGCHHASFLDSKVLNRALDPPKAILSNQLLQQKGLEHEAAYLQQLKDDGRSVTEIPTSGHLQTRAELTLNAMQSGVDVIYQAQLLVEPWQGVADFLMKCEIPSDLGEFSYEVLETKLARRAVPRHVMQLCVYSELLTAVQGNCPTNMYLVTGDGEQHDFLVTDFIHYCTHAIARFQNYIHNLPEDSSPEPCRHCEYCRWQDRCKAQWAEDNHLSLIANIQRSQINKLRRAGISTVTGLSNTPPDAIIPDLNQEVFLRLRSQAVLQSRKASTGQDRYELIPFPLGKGLNRLPIPDDGDLFFDMEGDPFYPDGLEYLFGIYYVNNGQSIFRPFWAHNHREEKEAFKKFMDFVTKHLFKYPHAHLYHYNHYETTALKRLACHYALREEPLDNLLRTHRFVDLYQVVRESLRTSEPGYSIKNMETFYMDKRTDTVSTAIDSIIAYNQWRITQSDQLLQEIADYNQKDCVSTRMLRDWLLSLRPARDHPSLEPVEAPWTHQPKRKEWEIEYEHTLDMLEVTETIPISVRQRLSHLLEFHNREAKPRWWSSFERQSKYEDELIEDAECIGGLQMTGHPIPDKKSLIYTYQFPPQEYKLKPENHAVSVATLENIGTISDIDDTACTTMIKCGIHRDKPPERLSLGPEKPYNTKLLRQAIYGYANFVLYNSNTSHVATELLSRNFPRIRGKQAGDPIYITTDLQNDALKVIENMQNSYLFIQGPPGAGKTHTSSHIIVGLMQRGKKIGVTSNSHKAIHNLLDKVEQVAAENEVSFVGYKKATKDKTDTIYQSKHIISEAQTEYIDLNANLFAGTAWAFANNYFHRRLDYLFIDEAGQVSTANVVAMANATRNIVLVGDQMQLGQPIQGIHPGEAGLSVLDFLLGDYATIPPERGIFLDQTRRMQPSICRFISEAFYDGRLTPHESTMKRHLHLKDVDLPNDGVVVIASEHEGCSQKSVEEGNIIKAKYQVLLGQPFIDGDNRTRPISEDDILVIAPYNVQVNYLRSILPSKARVGTIDKFQGQEAPIVLISMVTSSSEDLPRHIDFLYSKNRLNVAISRAQCLAVVVMNPMLLDISCKTVDQMKLVNTFCGLAAYAQNAT